MVQFICTHNEKSISVLQTAVCNAKFDTWKEKPFETAHNYSNNKKNSTPWHIADNYLIRV